MSVDSSGAEANDYSSQCRISADSRCVAFHSHATNLVVGDTNGNLDVFVRDLITEQTTRVSVDSSGAQASGGLWPSISADGRYVVFESEATDLVPGDTNGERDIFLHARQSGQTTRVSVSSSGLEGDASSFSAFLSSDSQCIAFESLAKTLVPGDSNDDRDVFVHDRQNGQTTRVSVSSAGIEGNMDSVASSISGDGRYVTFTSSASNLVPNDTNGSSDIFVHDRESGVTTRVSVSSSGAEGNSSCTDSWISLDGRYVAFDSSSSNLVASDTNGLQDVFVHDRQTGATTRVSVDSSGAGGNDFSALDEGPSFSVSGRHVVFISRASNLVPGDTNGFSDVFVHDRQTAETRRVSLDSSGTEGNGSSRVPAITFTGHRVVFDSLASNLVSGDTNGVRDVFVHGSPNLGVEFCSANPNSTGGPARISAWGSASSADGALRLDVVSVPNHPGIFFHGLNQSQLPFGNGYLCANGGIDRGAVLQAAWSFATYTYDNSDAKHSLAAYVGSTRQFQYWFRDPMGGGAFFNTSTAVSIAVLP